MERAEFDNRLEAFANLLKTEPDFQELMDSKEFRDVGVVDMEFAHNALRGRTFILTGDIRSIHILGFGKVQMMVTTSNKFNGVSNSTEVCVQVPDVLKAEVLKLRTDTGVKLKVKYKKFNVVVDIFELVEIIESDKLLKFPYCVCLGNNPNPDAYADYCHKVLGYTEDTYSGHCPMCGSTTVKFFDVYCDKFRELGAKYDG